MTIKPRLLLILLLLMTALPAHAQENKWIDGIKIRIGSLSHGTTFGLPWVEEGSTTIIETNNDLSHLEDPYTFPIAIALPETLMGPWSFRGAVFEYQPRTELKDLAPNPINSEISSTTEQFRQQDHLRTSLYNNFFNASDQAFADANSNWALSADVTSSRVFLGYYWGVFIPAFEYNRFMKLGLGMGVFHAELSYKLNLCSQYKVTPKLEDGEVELKGHGGECVGKTEIDSAGAKGVGVALIVHITLWERVTKDSVWKFASADSGTNLTDTTDALKLKNHDKNLRIDITSMSFEFISYTYRF